MKRIAIYGKGGAGKTTIAANVAAALAEQGGRVLLIGCGPAGDSSHLLLGERLPLPLASLSAPAASGWNDDRLASGFRGIGCVEVGGTSSGGGCSSKNLAAALERLEALQVYARFAPDVVLYDMPAFNGCIDDLLLAELPVDRSLVVMTADFQSLYAVNRFLAALARPGTRRLPLALATNGSTSSFEDAFVADFARLTKVPLVASIPRSFAVRQSELYGKTVIEAGPLSTHAYAYRDLARRLQDGSAAAAAAGSGVPLEPAHLKAWAHDWGKRLGELEFGILADGGGI